MLTEDDWAKIYEISEKRYQQWDWNYGKSPSFNYQESKKFPGGLVDVRLDVKKGIIENCIIYGDFFGIGNVKELEDALTGIRHNRDAINEALGQVDVSHYLGRISKEEFLELLY